MPRKARKQSEANLYHVMLRGNGQREVFQDAEDNEQFIAMLKACKQQSGFRVYAYCMMGNHVHLLIKIGENGEPLGQIFRRLGARYVYWYNTKYTRIGHLFQDRYKSEVVEDDAYLLCVLRYIHNNPVKAGMVASPAEHHYSSYNDYLKPSVGQLTDTEFVLSLMNPDAFARFHKKWDEAEYMDIKPIRPRMTDTQARELMQEITHCETVDEFQNLSRDQKNNALAQLKKKGMTYRQINRLTGESIGRIQRIY